MKNTAINRLGYAGIVTLSQHTGTKKRVIAQLSNEGKNSLFNFLADCLVGDFDIAKPNRPTKIMILKKNIDKDTKETSYSSKSGFIYQRSIPEKLTDPHENIAKVTYSFIIPTDKLTEVDFNSGYCLGLYTNSTTEQEFDQFAAIVDLTTTDGANISTSAALVIDWTLNIFNTTSKSTN